MTSKVGSTEHLFWIKGLEDIPEGQIRHGMKKASSFTGYFTLPTFRELCQVTPEEMGLPSLDAAWSEAGRQAHDTRRYKWSHVAVYKALIETGVFDVLHATGANEIREVKKLFARNYEIVCRKVLAGEDLNVEIPKALPSKIARPADPNSQEYKDFRAQMAQMFPGFGESKEDAA